MTECRPNRPYSLPSRHSGEWPASGGRRTHGSLTKTLQHFSSSSVPIPLQFFLAVAPVECLLNIAQYPDSGFSMRSINLTLARQPFSQW